MYAFLSSKYGVPLVVSGTYGAIIQSIEPQHIANLPVPRFGPFPNVPGVARQFSEAEVREATPFWGQVVQQVLTKAVLAKALQQATEKPAQYSEFEWRVHQLVQQAAELRSEAAVALRHVSGRFDRLLADIDLDQRSPRVSAVSSRKLTGRMDAAYHDVVVQRIRERIASGAHTTVGEMCSEVFLPGIFKRLYTEDPQYGTEYFTGASLFCLEPQSKGILSARTSLYDDVILTSGTILVQAFGQEGGLTGRPVWVGSHLDNKAATHMLVRLQARGPSVSGYLFGFLTSEAGYRQLAALPYGGSIPHLDEKGISSVVVPLLGASEVAGINETVVRSMAARDRALGLDRQARSLVESAIEMGGA